LEFLFLAQMILNDLQVMPSMMWHDLGMERVDQAPSAPPSTRRTTMMESPSTRMWSMEPEREPG
jgi:hypothetical protein